MPSEPLTLFAEDHPAKTFPWLDAVEVWMANGADCSGISAVSLILSLPVGLSGRTSLALCPATTEPTLLPCCGDSPEHSPTCPMAAGEPAEWWSDPNGQLSGGCLTLNGSEWPSDGVACSLSQVLETNVDPKYSLSPKACRGILTRSAKRGKTLPEHLAAALREVAQNQTPTE